LNNWLSVNTNPWYKLANGGLTPSFNWSGADLVADVKISATSSKSLQKLWIPNSLASSICFIKRLRMFSDSARALLYLSSKSLYLSVIFCISVFKDSISLSLSFGVDSPTASVLNLRLRCNPK
uniref:Neur_chan_LBD domain-containing protein n=1 Tax=Schistosoma curassoni TaxID=6186 RepID=A0A183L7E6_9TREM